MSHKLIDCFLFYNELDMLKYRLEYLYDIVDIFVLVESTLTFSGDNKELYYHNNKHLFEKYNDKIIHIIVDDLPNKDITKDAWVRERKHRNSIDRGIHKLNLDDNDIICICDLDEIPDRRILNIFKNIQKIENIPYALEQDMYYYNLTCRARNKWYHPKLINYYTYKNIFNMNCENIRICQSFYIIKNGGWHFSYFGNVDFIKNKIKHFSHQEYNNEKYLNDEKILQQIKVCGDLFFRDNNETKCHFFEYCSIEDNDYLPENYQELLGYSDIYKK